MTARGHWSPGPSSKRPALAVAVTLVLLSLPQARLSGQLPHRSALWLESGIGNGSARNACGSCQDVTSSYGSANHVRVGWALTSSVLVGGEVFSYHADEAVHLSDGRRSDVQSVSMGPIVIWYIGNHGFFFKAGVGLARGTFVARAASGQTTEADGLGSSLTLGVGFDLPLLSWLALTANVGTYVTAIGDVRLDSLLIDDVIQRVYQAGIGLTLR